MRNMILRVWIILLLMPITAYASSVYNNCIFSWQFGNVNQASLTITPAGALCVARCQTACAGFSYTSYNGQLNQDIIDQCMVTCQSGQIYQSYYRIPNPSQDAWYPFIWSSEPASAGVACDLDPTQPDSASYIYYAAGKNANPGDPAVFTLFNAPNSTGNTIYMCGMATTMLYPTIYSFEETYWLNNPNMWSIINTDPSTWHSRNYHWTNTGIDFKNGDYMNINMGWGYIWQTSHGSNWNWTGPIAYSLEIRPPYTSSNIWDDNSYFSSEYLLHGTSLEIPSVNTSGNQNISMQQAAQNNAQYTFFGLQNSIIQQIRSYTETNSTMQETYANSPVAGSAVQSNYAFNMITYQGIISGFSDNWTRLGVMHEDGNGSDAPSHWGDNLGGQFVQITWRGCPYHNGERLQYAIVPVQSNAETEIYAPEILPEDQWYDVPQDAIQNGTEVALQGAGPGALYLRIKPLLYDASIGVACNPAESLCQESMANVQNNYGPQNTSGQYYVSIDFTGNTASVASFVSSIINSVQSYLFGSSSNAGIVQNIFNTMVGESQWIRTIQALLALYIAYTGLSYISGFATINQKDGLIRCIKIGVIIALISPNSWQFFNTYLFNLFISGGMQIIADIVLAASGSAASSSTVTQDPAQVFAIFDTPFSELFSSEVWIKILAMLMSSMIGFILAIVMAFAVVTYIFCIGKAIIIYLMSLIAIALLLILAPIFISFVLFEYTRQFFDAWMKQLLAFTLQPIFAFGIIAILNNLLLLALYISLAFTACKVCFFGIGIVGVEYICLVPGYSTLMELHYPNSDFLGMPLTQVAAILLFMILAQSTYVLLDYCTGVAGQLATGGSFLSLNLGDVFSQSGPLSKGLQSIGSATGMDAEATQSRQALLQPIKQGLSKAKQSRAAPTQGGGGQS